MPRLELNNIQEFEERPGETRTVRKINYCVSLKAGKDRAQVFIQHGLVWGEDGQQLKPDTVPDWFEEECRKISPEMLEKLKFDYDRWATTAKPRGRPRKEASSPDMGSGDGKLVSATTPDSSGGG